MLGASNLDDHQIWSTSEWYRSKELCIYSTKIRMEGTGITVRQKNSRYVGAYLLNVKMMYKSDKKIIPFLHF